MFCPKCGTQIENTNDQCMKCGYHPTLKTDGKTSAQSEKEPTTQEYVSGKFEKIKATKKPVYCIAAGIVAIMCFYAAACISDGGAEISMIQSIGGQTLEEAYYQSLGLVYAGYAMAVRAFGVFSAMVLIKLGSKE